MTEILLIRHGFAVRINGDYVHAPITALGQEQAEMTGKFLTSPSQKLTALFTSPLRRTAETATIIGKTCHLNPEEQTGVRELTASELVPLVTLEVLSIFDPVEDYLESHVGKSIRWPIEGRVSTVLLDLVAKYPNGRLGIVTHSGVISSVLAWLLPDKRWSWWRHVVGNCSITRVTFGQGKPEVSSIGDVTHLHDLATDQPPTRTVEIVEKVHPTAKPTTE